MATRATPPDRDAGPTRRRPADLVAPAVALAALLGAWQVWVQARGVEPYVLPSPGRIARTAVDIAPRLGGRAATTVGEAALGLVIGALVGVALAVLIARFRLALQVLYPLVAVSQKRRFGSCAGTMDGTGIDITGSVFASPAAGRATAGKGRGPCDR